LENAEVPRLSIGTKIAVGVLEMEIIPRRRNMPAKSKAQQKAAGAALAAKRGHAKKSDLKGASKEMEKSMSEKQLEEFASTKHKSKPEHVAHR
jgi:hypothetical protein